MAHGTAYNRGYRDAQKGLPYNNPFESGSAGDNYLVAEYRKGFDKGKAQHEAKIRLLRGQVKRVLL